VAGLDHVIPERRAAAARTSEQLHAGASDRLFDRVEQESFELGRRLDAVVGRFRHRVLEQPLQERPFVGARGDPGVLHGPPKGRHAAPERARRASRPPERQRTEGAEQAAATAVGAEEGDLGRPARGVDRTGCRPVRDGGVDGAPLRKLRGDLVPRGPGWVRVAAPPGRPRQARGAIEPERRGTGGEEKARVGAGRRSRRQEDQLRQAGPLHASLVQQDQGAGQARHNGLAVRSQRLAVRDRDHPAQVGVDQRQVDRMPDVCQRRKHHRGAARRHFQLQIRPRTNAGGRPTDSPSAVGRPILRLLRQGQPPAVGHSGPLDA
jgi:hypothetical protein